MADYREMLIEYLAADGLSAVDSAATWRSPSFTIGVSKTNASGNASLISAMSFGHNVETCETEKVEISNDMVCPNVVTLKSGYIVSLELLRLGWALEERGCSLEIDGDAVLITPHALVTQDEEAMLRQHVTEMRQLLKYVEALG